MDMQHEIGIAAHKFRHGVKDNQGELICIEGIIGAGKSTLTKALAEMLGAKAMYEPVEENPYLELFYGNPKRYALEMQHWLMSKRFEMHVEAIQHTWTKRQTVIMDRSIYGDWVFAKKNWQDGNISDLGYQSYLKHRDVMNRFLLTPHKVLWLVAHPVTCQERIGQRGRDCESSIPLDYLKGLHVLHAELMDEMRARGSKVYTLDWDTPYQNVADVAAQIGR